MALQYTPQDIDSGYLSTEVLAENFDDIQEALADGLSRSGQSPNAMGTDIDMQGHRIYNLPQAISNGEPVTYAQLIANLTPQEFAGYLYELQTATDGQTVFTTANAFTPGLNALRVFVNGLYYPPSEYVENDENTVTMTVPLEEGDEISFVITSFAEADYDTAATVQYQNSDGSYTSLQTRIDQWYPRTAAEIAAGVTPTDYQYPPGDVRRYGAVGDGVTDDTAAINAATSVDQDVFVPSGTYMINADGTWTGTTNSGASGGVSLRSGQTLTLEKSATLKALLNSSGAYNVIRCYNVSDVTIEGGTIEGDLATHVGVLREHGFGIGVWGSSKVTIRDTVITACWGDGIFVDLHSGTPSSGLNVSNVRCTANRRNGLSLVSAEKVYIAGSTFDSQSGTSPEAGIGIEPDTTKSVTGVIVTGCRFYDNAGQGMYASRINGVSVSDINYDSCQASNCQYGFVMRGVINGGISNCIASGSSLYGVLIEDSQHITVSGVSAYGNDRDGMRIAATTLALPDVSDVAVSGCDFSENGTGSNGNGLAIVPTSGEEVSPQRISVTGCTFALNKLVGLSALSTKNSVISGNIFRANGQATNNTYANLRLNKLTAVACDRVLIDGNIFIGAEGGAGINQPNYHIQLSDADNCLITSNDMSIAAGTAAMSIAAASTGNTYKGNVAYDTSAPETGILTASKTHDFDGTDGATTTLTVTGAVAGDDVAVTWADATAGVAVRGYVSSADTVTLVKTGAGNPGSLSYLVRVFSR